MFIIVIELVVAWLYYYVLFKRFLFYFIISVNRILFLCNPFHSSKLVFLSIFLSFLRILKGVGGQPNMLLATLPFLKNKIVWINVFQLFREVFLHFDYGLHAIGLFFINIIVIFPITNATYVWVFTEYPIKQKVIKYINAHLSLLLIGSFFLILHLTNLQFKLFENLYLHRIT